MYVLLSQVMCLSLSFLISKLDIIIEIIMMMMMMMVGGGGFLSVFMCLYM